MLIKEFIKKQNKVRKNFIESFKVGDSLRAIRDTRVILRWDNKIDINKDDIYKVIGIDDRSHYPIKVRSSIEVDDISIGLSYEDLEDFERVLG